MSLSLNHYQDCLLNGLGIAFELSPKESLQFRRNIWVVFLGKKQIKKKSFIWCQQLIEVIGVYLFKMVFN